MQRRITFATGVQQVQIGCVNFIRNFKWKIQSLNGPFAVHEVH